MPGNERTEMLPTYIKEVTRYSKQTTILKKSIQSYNFKFLYFCMELLPLFSSAP
jgi:hypothetical protein